MYKSKHIILPSLFALASVLLVIYWPAFDGPFLVDDQQNLPDTKIDHLSLTSLWAVANGNNSGIFGRPLPVITFALNYYFGNGSPSAFKVTNWAFHFANSLLIFVLCRMLLLQAFRGTKQLPSYLTVIALFVTTLWAIHPLQISTVMYVVQRMNIMATMFCLIALVTYTRFRCQQLEGQGNILLTLSIVCFATIFSCLSKENGALTPLYILLIEWVFFQFKQNDAQTQKRFRALYFLLSFTTILLGGIVFYIYFDYLMGGYQMRDFSLTERLMTQPLVLMSYMKMILLPALSDMTFYHDDFQTAQIFDQRTVIACFFICALLLISFASIRKASLVAFGVLFYMTSQLMESTVFPLEMMFEHRNYLGLFGLMLASVSICISIFLKIPSRTLRTMLGILTIACLGFSAHMRAMEWSSDIKLHTFAVKNQPLSTRARSAYIAILINNGRDNEALEQIQQLQSLKPEDPYVALFSLQVSQKANVHIEGLVQQAIKLVASENITKEVIQSLLELSTRRDDPNYPSFKLKYHISLFESAINNPNKLVNASSQGFLYGQLGEMLFEADRTSDAVIVYRKALEFFPESMRMGLMYVDMLIADGDVKLAREKLESIRPKIQRQNTQALSRVADLDARLEVATSYSVEVPKL